MTDSNGRKLSPAAARNLGMYRESWCAVEMKKEQSWCRKERKHDPEQFSSSVFDKHQPGYEPRCTFAVEAPTHRERRHYQDQYIGLTV
ncbi:protein SPATA45 homolog [Mizuhopecten yessoensis]|uniref:protein SPATA45 homolog n=1 Tax=Mizuhopecten yessoensis TaxID=6573 RepID=UPI000B45E2EE|nr:protein SPATA45 homolog [Mizuhopecten yessoensis]